MSQAESWPKQEENNEAQQEDQIQQQQKRKNRKRVISNPNQSTGHWSEQEHQTYVDFLNMHRTVMESQDQKKTSKIFKLMSETIGTRSPSQCRSHHQKFNPFVHQVKKRQKGAGRKKRCNSPQIEKNFNTQEHPFLQQLMFQCYPQQFMPNCTANQDYPMMHYSQIPLMFPLVENKEEVDPSLQYYYNLMAQAQIQQLDDKNLFFMHPQQMQFNFNYFQQPNDFLPQGEIINKDNQFEEQQ